MISIALGAAALLAGSQAHALTWAWSYSGTGVSASGTVSTAGSATSFEAITGFTGQRNGVAIIGLVPIGGDPRYIFDNVFSAATPYLSLNGLLYDIGGGNTGHFNLGISNGSYYEISGPPNTVLSGFTFNVTPVPEPDTLIYMAAGLVVVAGIRRARRKRAD